MPDDKAQDAQQEPAQNIRQPVYAVIHAQQAPCERQQQHHPAVLRHDERHRTRDRQVVHRVARGEAVLVEWRDLGLDFRVRGKRARTLGTELDDLINNEAHRKRHQGLPENRQKIVEPDTPENEQHEQHPYITVAEAHIELEELFRLFRKMAVGPVHRHAVVKICDFLEHRIEFRFFRAAKASIKAKCYNS